MQSLFNKDKFIWFDQPKYNMLIKIWSRNQHDDLYDRHLKPLVIVHTRSIISMIGKMHMHNPNFGL